MSGDSAFALSDDAGGLDGALPGPYDTRFLFQALEDLRMSDESKHSYKDTVNLPETSFAMKANLVQREPQMRKHWAQQKMYE